MSRGAINKVGYIVLSIIFDQFESFFTTLSGLLVMDLASKEQAFHPMGFLDLQLHLVEMVVWLPGSVLTQPTEKLPIRKENVPAPGAKK